MTGRVFLRWATSEAALAGRLLGAPDAQQVVVDLERDAERPAERPIPPDDRLVVGRQQRAGLDRCGDERRRLATDHVEVGVDRHDLVRLAGGDVDVLALAQRQARLVEQPHQPQDLRVGEAELGQPVERDARQAEQRVAGVDRLGDAVDRPQRRSVAALGVAVLDVVVDEAEVVAQLDRGRARQRPPVVAGDRRVGEQSEQRPDALAAVRVLAVQREVVADHLVQPVRRRVAVLDEADDLALGVGDEVGELKVRRGGGHLPVSLHRNVSAGSSLLMQRHATAVTCEEAPARGTRPRRRLMRIRRSRRSG